MNVINLKNKFSKITEPWSPKIIASMNDYMFKVAKFHGEFTWHKHEETDEVFIVIKGEMYIDFRDKRVNIKEGEMVIVPKDTEHKPGADNICEVLLIEPEGTLNTGNVQNEYTVNSLDWI